MVVTRLSEGSDDETPTYQSLSLFYLVRVYFVAAAVGGVRPPAVRGQSHGVRLLARAADGRAQLGR